MKTRLIKTFRALIMVSLCTVLASCEEPAVYGSVGFSNYHGGWGGSGMRTSVSIGGRIR